jgi:Leucine-rich repeat (LRR) protein
MQLYDDVIFNLLTFLTPSNIYKCGLINKQFDMISKSELIRKHKCKEYPKIVDNYYVNYKTNYIINELSNILGCQIFAPIHGRLQTHSHYTFDDVESTKKTQSVLLQNRTILFLPLQMRLLTNLRTITIFRVHLRSIKHISSLVNLEDFYCENNNLKSIPKELGLLTKLKKLELPNNNINSMPEELSLLTNLTLLNLRGNKLETVEINTLTNLTRLDLQRNNLQDMPEIYSLTNLQRLYLNENQLQCISPEIGQLTKLDVLHLQYNNFISMPKEISLLENLYDFRVKN